VRGLTLAAVVAYAHWFFGNLYETVVISPNWVVDTDTQLRRLDEFFVNTDSTLYFVPLFLVGPVLTWILFARNRRQYRAASAVALVLTVLNALIVGLVVLPLFDPDVVGKTSLAWTWNGLNLVRMALTATAGVLMFQVFRKLDRSAG
jgi:hypothetical protein